MYILSSNLTNLLDMFFYFMYPIVCGYFIFWWWNEAFFADAITDKKLIELVRKVSNDTF